MGDGLGFPAKKYRTAAGAQAYRGKHGRTLLRRIASRRETALLHRMLQRLAPLTSIVDCPCGAGRFLPCLARHADVIYGVDLSRELLQWARSVDSPARFVTGNAAQLPFPDRSVDAVVCCRLLHHILLPDDRIRILSEARRVARRGVVVSFADADTRKGRRTRSRRRPISRAELRREAAAAGLSFDPTVLSLSGFFSSFSYALLRVSEN